jgi:hypothetical protein
MCQYHHVYITMYMCVSIFTIIFLNELCYLCLLDPNAYAKDDDLVALDSRANRDSPS